MSSSNVIELFKNSEQHSLQEQLGLLAEIIQSCRQNAFFIRKRNASH